MSARGAGVRTRGAGCAAEEVDAGGGAIGRSRDEAKLDGLSLSPTEDAKRDPYPK